MSEFCSYFSIDCFVCPTVANLVAKLTAMQDIVHSFQPWLDEVGPGSSCVYASGVTCTKSIDVNASGGLGLPFLNNL